MIKKLLIVCLGAIAVPGLVISCKNELAPEKALIAGGEPTSVTESSDAPAFQKIAGKPTQAQLNAEVLNTNGGNFITTTKIEGDKAVIVLDYDYQTFKQAHPATKIDEQTFYGHFKDDQTIKDAMNEMPAMLFRKFPGINAIDYSLNTKENVYNLRISKMQFEDFFGADMQSLEKDYSQRVTEPLLYEEGIKEAFFRNYGSVSN